MSEGVCYYIWKVAISSYVWFLWFYSTALGLSFELKNEFDSLDWIIGINQVMVPFGDFIGRKETHREFRSSWEGLGDGYYAIFEYISNYENTVEHSERIILHQDHRGKWRILDYGYLFTEGKNYKEYDLSD